MRLAVSCLVHSPDKNTNYLRSFYTKVSFRYVLPLKILKGFND